MLPNSQGLRRGYRRVSSMGQISPSYCPHGDIIQFPGFHKRTQCITTPVLTLNSSSDVHFKGDVPSNQSIECLTHSSVRRHRNVHAHRQNVLMHLHVYIMRTESSNPFRNQDVTHKQMPTVTISYNQAILHITANSG